MHVMLMRFTFTTVFIKGPAERQGDEKLVYESFDCSPPRKSLVKGERFMRDEGKPELPSKAKIGSMSNVMPQDMWDR